MVHPDAAGKPLGKTAVRAADLLRGKTKPTFTPNADCGDYVIIINAGKAVLTGKKGTQKMYRTHSGWIGGLKETPYRILMQEQPELAMKVAVRGMLPKNTIGKESLKRLHIYGTPTTSSRLRSPSLWTRNKEEFEVCISPRSPYLYGTGRRKSSVARVHLFPNGTGSITVNGRSIDEYFGLDTLKMLVRQPSEATGNTGKMDVVATVTGGGVSGQAGALRHGVARALLLASEDNRPILKKAGFLTRDPRMKERKKYGLKAARRAPQFSKR